MVRTVWYTVGSSPLYLLQQVLRCDPCLHSQQAFSLSNYFWNYLEQYQLLCSASGALHLLCFWHCHPFSLQHYHPTDLARVELEGLCKESHGCTPFPSVPDPGFSSLQSYGFSPLTVETALLSGHTVHHLRTGMILYVCIDLSVS